VIIGSDLFEPGLGVQRPGRFHFIERIEQHHVIAGLSGMEECEVHQQSADTKPAKGPTHEQALHLTGVGVVAIQQRTEGTTTCHIARHARHHQATGRRRIVPRQPSQLVFEALKTEVDADIGLILAEKIPGHGHIITWVQQHPVHGRAFNRHRVPHETSK